MNRRPRPIISCLLSLLLLAGAAQSRERFPAPEQPATEGNRVWWKVQEVQGGTQTTIDLAGPEARAAHVVDVQAQGDGEGRGNSVRGRSAEATPEPVPTLIKLPAPGNLSCQYRDVCFSRVENASEYAAHYPLLDGSRGVGRPVNDGVCHCNPEGDPDILCVNLSRSRVRGEASYELSYRAVGDPPYVSSDLSDAIVVDDFCDSNWQCEEGYFKFWVRLGETEFEANDGSLYCGHVTQTICLGEGADQSAVQQNLAGAETCELSLHGSTFRAVADLCAAVTGVPIYHPLVIEAKEKYISARTGGNWKPFLKAPPGSHITECYRLQRPTLSLHFSDQFLRYYLQWSVSGLSPGDKVDIELQLYDYDADTETGVWDPPTRLAAVDGINGIHAFNRSLYSPGDRFRVRAIPSGKPSTSLLVSEYSEPVSLFPDPPP